MIQLVAFLWSNSKRLFLFSLFGGLVGGIGETGLIALVHRASAGRVGSTLIWTFVALCLLLPVFHLASNNALVALAQRATAKLVLQLGGRIIETPLSRVEVVGPPRLLSALTDDVSVVSHALSNIPTLFLNGTFLLASLAYLAWLSWQAMLVVLLATMLALVATYLAFGWGMRADQSARTSLDKLFDHFNGLIYGIKELQLNLARRRSFMSDLLEPSADEYQRRNLTATTIYASLWSGLQMFFFALIGVVVIALPGRLGLSYTTVTGFALALFYLLTPLGMLSGTLSVMGRGRTALLNLESLGFLIGEQKAPEGGERLPAVWKQLDLIDVRYTYSRPDGPGFSVGPINLSFSPGELIFITGGNGSGKTTLGKLLTGLYAPESGEVRLNNRPVTDETRSEYREYFSAIFSDSHLFTRLLGIDAWRIQAHGQEFIEMLKLDGKVQIQDGAFTSVALSQGQRKRLALVTAYLEDRPIYLFDEWAADQDPHLRDTFYRRFLPELKARGKAVLVISHDDRYYSLADRLITLEYGAVREDRCLAAQVVS
jgi:putative ATP-binding cassette transporter